MKTRILLYIAILPVLMAGCRSNNYVSDASGTFEADEVIVSAEVPGKIMSLNLDEGSILKKDSIVGEIDSIPLELQKAQLSDDILERDRTINLLKADAATQKQLDDWNNQVDVLKKQIHVNEQQIKVTETNTGTQNNTVMSEYKPLKKSIAEINDQLSRTNIKNPINGTVLIKYAMAGEETSAGKALYQIADISIITLRVYITGTQLSQVKLNQPVKVLVDSTASTYKTYPGIITFISDKAEFTPKTIQTKDERANLVYAVKIHVENDGLLKIGMYGEVKFN
jgi:HlyD family secretion protein